MHGKIDLDFVISKQGGSLSRQLSYIGLGSIGAIGLFYTLKKRRDLRWNPRFALLLSLLLGWSALSLLWTDLPEITAKRLFVLGLIFLGALGLAVSWNQIQILKFIVLSAALQVGVGVVAELSYGFFTPFSPDYRFAGTLPWNSQGYLCLVLTLAALCVVKLKQPKRWIYGVLASFGFVFLLLTRSRGALAALGMALILYFFAVIDLPRKIMTALLAGTVAIVLVMSGFGATLVDVLNRGGEGSENFTGRAPLWEELMTYAGARLWTGYGYEAFWTEKSIEDISTDQRWAIDTAHSGYIECLLMLGLVGASLHTLTLVAGLTEGVRTYLRTQDMAFFLAASICFVYLVGGGLEALLIVKASQSSFYFALLLCVIVRGPENSRDIIPVTQWPRRTSFQEMLRAV